MRRVRRPQNPPPVSRVTRSEALRYVRATSGRQYYWASLSFSLSVFLWAWSRALRRLLESEDDTPHTTPR